MHSSQDLDKNLLNINSQVEMTQGSTDSDAIHIELDTVDYIAKKEEDASRCAKVKPYLIYASLAILPIITTLSDTALIYFSVDDAKDETLVFHILLREGNLLAMKIIAPSLFFLSALALNIHWSLMGMSVTQHIYKNEKIPDEWPILTNQQIANIVDDHELPSNWPQHEDLSTIEKSNIINRLHAKKFREDFSHLSKKSCVIMTAILSSSAVIDSMNSFYYVSDLLEQNDNNQADYIYFKITASLVATIYGSTNLFSEGMETIETFAKKESPEYFSNTTKYLTTLFNYSSTVIGSITTTIEDFFPIVILLGVTSPIGKSAALAWTVTKFMTDYCLQRANVYEALQEVAHFFSTEQREKRSLAKWLVKIGVFGVTIYNAALLADLQRAFFIQLIHNPLTEAAVLPFEMPEWLIETLGRGRSVRDLIVNTYFLGPFFQGCFDVLTYIPKKMVSGLSQCCKKDYTELTSDFEGEGRQLVTIASSPSQNRSAFFSRSSSKQLLLRNENSIEERENDQTEFPKNSSCVIL